MGLVVLGLGGAAVLAGAGYLVYKAWQSSSTAQAQEAAKSEGLTADAGGP